MMKINPGRDRPKNRVPSQTDKTAVGQTKTFGAPVAGLVTNTPMANASGTSLLIAENFWPTARGIAPRGGTRRRVNIPNPVEELFQYVAGGNQAQFVADANNIYMFDENTAEEAALTAVVTGQTSSAYTTQEMQTDGGSFLLVVNGTDDLQIFDGMFFQAVNDTSTPFAITGVDTSTLSHVWAHRNRIFFVQKDTMDAYFLGINSVAGVATRLPLAGVFDKGGSLLYGATWSSDSGSGMDDRCIFATDQGEFAVFAGSNPADINDWNLQGVYEIGEPLDKNAHISVGGDLIVATKAGLIPLSAATQKDVAALKLDALTYSIDPDWRRETILSGHLGGWRLAKWGSRNMAVVAPPNRDALQGYCWAVNLETGAWTKFTGWRVGDIAVLDDRLYFGDATGNVFEADTGGTDDGVPFECRLCYGFDHMGMPGSLKTVHAMRATWRYQTAFNARMTVATDYRPDFPAALDTPLGQDNNPGTWDAATWDADYWASDEETYQVRQKWVSASGHGETIAPQIQIVSGQSSKLDCELISIDVTYSSGGTLV